MSYELSVLGTSSDIVKIDPDWDMGDISQILVNQTYAYDGFIDSTKWSSFNQWELNFSYMPHSDAQIINEWWNDNDDLRLVFDTTSYDVRIMNDNNPFPSLKIPYYDAWVGTLLCREIS